MLRLLVAAALVVAVSAEPEADPQYITSPYYTPYQPVVSYYPQPQVASYPQYQQVAPSSYAEPKEDTSALKPTLYNANPIYADNPTTYAVPSYTPMVYSADPGIFAQLPKGSGKYLPGVFGWDRGSDYFKKWNTVPVPLRANRVRWRTDGQRMSNGFNSASGADPNKFTDKYSNPGSYQGRRKREAEPQYIVSPYSYSYPQYQPVAAPVQVENSYVPTTYAVPSYTPMVYSADPGIFAQLPKGSGKYLPGVFGWDRGSDYFKKWNTVPVPLRANRVRWSTDGQRMSNGFNSASGADPNKFTDKYSNPGSYQG